MSSEALSTDSQGPPPPGAQWRCAPPESATLTALLRSATPSSLNDWGGVGWIAALLVGLVFVACDDMTSRPRASSDLIPSFEGSSIAAQRYTVGQMIDTLMLPAANGGDGILTYTLTPAPPAGLTFDATARTLSGTPTAPVTENYTLRVEDADKDSAWLRFSITVVEFLRFEESHISDRHYTVGIMIDALVLPAAKGGSGPLTYTLTPTPEGLTFDATSRMLSGRPTAENLYGMTYSVRDADGDQASRKFLVTVAPAASYCSPGEFTETASTTWMIGDWDTSSPTRGDREVGQPGQTVLFVTASTIGFLVGYDTFFADTYGYSWTNEGATDDKKGCQTQESNRYAVEYKDDRVRDRHGIKVAIRRFDECHIWLFREVPMIDPVLLESSNSSRRPACDG